MDNKKKLLAGLLILLALSIGYRLMHPFRQARVTQLTHDGQSATKSRPASTSKAAPKEPAPAVEAPDQHIGAAQEPQIESAAAARNPFVVRRSSAMAPAESSPAPAPAPVDPLAQVRQELGEFKVFGSYVDSRGAALFLQRSNSIYLVRQGDHIENRYRVAGISPERMDLVVEASGDVVHIDLSEFNASRYALAEAAVGSGAGSSAPPPEEPPPSEEPPPAEVPEQPPEPAPQPPPVPEAPSRGGLPGFQSFGSSMPRSN